MKWDEIDKCERMMHGEKEGDEREEKGESKWEWEGRKKVQRGRIDFR